jgi:hypothetical protein
MKFRESNDLGEGPQLDEKAQKAKDDLIDAAESKLSHFIPSSEIEYFQNTMGKLVMDARNLHTMMMKSKAIFSVQWLGDDDGKQLAQFDSKSMDSIQSDIGAYTSQNVVEFVEAPALVKYGNADGEGFEFSTTLCKAWVVLREVEVISPSEDETISSTASHDQTSDDLSNAATEIKTESEQ